MAGRRNLAQTFRKPRRKSDDLSVIEGIIVLLFCIALFTGTGLATVYFW